jgi:hypothetical protein
MAKRQFMDLNGYPCAWVEINEDLWFYVEPKGVHIITQKGGGQGHISWSKVRKALDDHEQAKSRRKQS